MQLHGVAYENISARSTSLTRAIQEKTDGTRAQHDLWGQRGQWRGQHDQWTNMPSGTSMANGAASMANAPTSVGRFRRCRHGRTWCGRCLQTGFGTSAVR